MNMKEHLLAAMREQFNGWEELLASLSEEQITTPRYDLDWSIQDVLAHCWGWQQISIARMQAAASNREPEFPAWMAELPGDWEENADQTNAWFYAHLHQKPWLEVFTMWKDGYLLLLELSEHIPEKDLLDTGKYPWLNGYSPAFILVASYDHHQEHYEKVTASLK
jgi:hypothetical protein